MESYYRAKCRAIAVVDIIWSSIGFGTTLLTFFGIAILSQPRNFERHGDRLPSDLYELHSQLNDGSPADLETTPLDCVSEDFAKAKETEARLFAKLMLGMVMLVMGINSFQLIAAIRLLKACDLNSSVERSLKYCRFWLSITIFCVALVGLTLLSPARANLPGQIMSLVQVAFRVIGYHYVSLFMNELRSTLLPVAVECPVVLEAREPFYPKPPPYSEEVDKPPPYQPPMEESPPPYEEKV